jgi:lipopolysaccharide export system permease protein
MNRLDKSIGAYQFVPAGYRRVMFPTPFGLHTKHMFAAYLRDTTLMMSALLVIALSMDLAQYLVGVLTAVRGDSALGSMLYLGWYITLRSTDIVTEFLPLACFFGVFVAEIRHTLSHERLIMLITGRAPFQCLAPLALFAVMIGLIELILIVYLRPAAVMQQTAAHLGHYGDIFDRGPTAGPKWIVAGDTLIRADIEFVSSPQLRKVQIFRMSNEHQLREVIVAASATAVDDGKNWILYDGWRWSLEPGLTASGSPQTPLPDRGAADETRFSSDKIMLDVTPLRLRYFGIEPKYLPDGVFRKLANLALHPNSAFATWAQARLAIPVAAAAMVLMAGTLSLLLLTSEIRFWTIFIVTLAGFVTHLLTRLLLVLGDHGWIYPIMSGWFVPVLLLSGSFAVMQLARRSNPV